MVGRRVGRQARLSRKRSFANRQPPATPIRLANKYLILNEGNYLFNKKQQLEMARRRRGLRGFPRPRIPWFCGGWVRDPPSHSGKFASPFPTRQPQLSVSGAMADRDDKAEGDKRDSR